ncbi:MAG TPA: DNA polymerase III subunit gamma/tau [Chloroflexota bacterium]|nr:DNA polymerase III subunit gamma/tau [Chloroflexota bacterium]
MPETAGRALYLAWRPRTFDDVVGQRHIVQTLRNAVRNGTLGHAYLFAGPRGTGKTSIARLLFKAANCLDSEDGGSCERCAICTSANEGRALDLIEMDAASNRGIDDVRELRDKIHYTPAEARYRLYILDEAHQLTQPAWDALLKTLEEPPPHAILVLATTEAHKVPATVLSRCQRFDFHRIAAAEIRARLVEIAEREDLQVEPTVLSWLARAARGGLRDAISLLDQLRAFAGDGIDTQSAREVLGLAGLETVRPFLEALQEDRAGDALEELNAALERGTDLRVYVSDVLSYLRALLLLRYGASAALRAEFPVEEIEWLEGQVAEWEANRLRELVAGFGDALARFRDPAQLLVQVELTVVAGSEPPELAASPPLSADATELLPPESPEAAVASTAPSRSSRRDAPGSPAASTFDEPALPSDTEKLALEPADSPPRAEVDERPEPPVLDLAAVRDCWLQVQAQVVDNRPDQAWFHRCHLADIQGDTVVLRLEAGLHGYLDRRDRRLAIERKLGEAIERTLGEPLGRPIKIRIDDLGPRAGEGEEPPAGNRRPPMDDPILQAGLRLFGGPLEAVED